MVELSSIDIAVFGGLLVLIIAMLSYARFTLSSSMFEYLNLGRKLTLPLFIGTIVSSWYGMIFGVTQISFEHGIYNFITQGVFWYISAAMFALLIVGKIHKSKFITIPELLQNIYGSTPGKLSAILFVIKSLPYQYAVGFAAFLNYLFGFDMPITIATCILIISVYCYFGGLKGTMITDFMQFILMFVAIFLVIIFSLTKYGGIDYLRESLPKEHFEVRGNHSIFAVISWCMIAVSTTFLSPIFYTRALLAKSPEVAKKGILIAIFFWFICDLCTTFGGMYARAALPEAESYNAYLQYGLGLLPEGLKGVFLIGILVTLYSALDTFFFIPVTIIINDLLKDSLSNRTKKLIGITLAAGMTFALSMYGSFYIEKTMLMVEGLFLGTLMAPFLGGLFFKIQGATNFYIILALAVVSQVVAYNLGVEEYFFFGVLGGGGAILLIKLFEKKI